MAFPAKYTLAQWAEARRLRAEGQPFSRIAERLGFANPGIVSRRARNEGWLPVAGAKPAKARAAGPRSLAPAAARSRSILVQRLYGFMDLELRTLELSMQKKLDAYATSSDAEPPAVTDKERTSFAALIDNINKVTEMASEPALAADGRRKSATINRTLEVNQGLVDLVASGRRDETVFDRRFGYVTGREAFRPDADSEPYMRNTYEVRVVIRHDRRSSRGYRVHTAYPINRDPR